MLGYFLQVIIYGFLLSLSLENIQEIRAIITRIAQINTITMNVYQSLSLSKSIFHLLIQLQATLYGTIYLT